MISCKFSPLLPGAFIFNSQVFGTIVARQTITLWRYSHDWKNFLEITGCFYSHHRFGDWWDSHLQAGLFPRCDDCICSAGGQRRGDCTCLGDVPWLALRASSRAAGTAAAPALFRRLFLHDAVVQLRFRIPAARPDPRGRICPDNCQNSTPAKISGRCRMCHK